MASFAIHDLNITLSKSYVMQKEFRKIRTAVLLIICFSWITLFILMSVV